MSVQHHTIRASHEYRHDIGVVWAAWSDGDVKRQWFDLSDDPAAEWRSVFRTGGEEVFRSAGGVSPTVAYNAYYCDIVEFERIVSTISITIDGQVTSVSVSTAEFLTITGGTRLSVTEQVAFLDGGEAARDRTGGVESQLERLDDWLRPTNRT